MAEQPAGSFAPKTTTGARRLPKEKRPEAGKVQSANPKQTKEPGPQKLDAAQVNDAQHG